LGSQRKQRKRINTEVAETQRKTKKEKNQHRGHRGHRGCRGPGEEREKRAGQTRSMPREAEIEERFLSEQADRFAGANREEKVGLLRSK
jgi:hypothetical protein